jgi:hypothetical protein
MQQQQQLAACMCSICRYLLDCEWLAASQHAGCNPLRILLVWALQGCTDALATMKMYYM